MKPILRTVALCTLATTLTGGMAFAQDHHDDQDHHDNQRDNHHYVRHDEWKKGAHMNHDDWNRGERVEYQHYHLQAPTRGYEWREVDGNYVMAAVATGVIASVVAASAAAH
jgi:Ni/Co efflux regulator RcnB